MGLSWFYYKPGIWNLVRAFYWQLSYPTVSSFSFLIDDQFISFYYIILVINSYDCPNKSYPIQNYNNSSSRYECFDQCYSNQYELYSWYFSDYYC